MGGKEGGSKEWSRGAADTVVSEPDAGGPKISLTTGQL